MLNTRATTRVTQYKPAVKTNKNGLFAANKTAIPKATSKPIITNDLIKLALVLSLKNLITLIKPDNKKIPKMKKGTPVGISVAPSSIALVKVIIVKTESTKIKAAITVLVKVTINLINGNSCFLAVFLFAINKSPYLSVYRFFKCLSFASHFFFHM